MKKAFLIPFIVIILGGAIGGYFLFSAQSSSGQQVIKTKDLKKLTLKIEGMSCIGCKRSTEGSVASMRGVKKVNADLGSNSGIVVYNPQKINKKEIVNNSIFSVYPAVIQKDQKYKNEN
ncbi:MAG: heavy-metal-associated domain-containing protein [Candidatus Magasanikbacteria bacterium]